MNLQLEIGELVIVGADTTEQGWCALVTSAFKKYLEYREHRLPCTPVYWGYDKMGMYKQVCGHDNVEFAFFQPQRYIPRRAFLEQRRMPDKRYGESSWNGESWSIQGHRGRVDSALQTSKICALSRCMHWYLYAAKCVCAYIP